MTATFAGAIPLIKREHEWQDRNRSKDGYRSSLWHKEACVYRRIVATSKALTAGQGDRLAKMVNLWFKHRLDGLMRMGNNALADKMGVVRNTFRTFIRWAEGLGFVSVVAGGSGRGDKTAYAVNLGRIQEVLAPNITVTSGDTRVSIEGEIDEAQKGSIGGGPYIDNTKGSSFLPRFLRQTERFWLGRELRFGMMLALIERLRANRRGERVAGSKHCPAKPNFPSRDHQTGEIYG